MTLPHHWFESPKQGPLNVANLAYSFLFSLDYVDTLLFLNYGLSKFLLIKSIKVFLALEVFLLVHFPQVHYLSLLLLIKL